MGVPSGRGRPIFLDFIKQKKTLPKAGTHGRVAFFEVCQTGLLGQEKPLRAPVMCVRSELYAVEINNR